MKVVILYRPKSQHDTLVQDFVREYRRRTGKDIELVSLDTKAGATQAKLYDATVYPVILATREDGQLLNMWQGEVLPLIDEVSYYDQTPDISI